MAVLPELTLQRRLMPTLQAIPLPRSQLAAQQPREAIDEAFDHNLGKR